MHVWYPDYQNYSKTLNLIYFLKSYTSMCLIISVSRQSVCYRATEFDALAPFNFQQWIDLSVCCDFSVESKSKRLHVHMMLSVSNIR